MSDLSKFTKTEIQVLAERIEDLRLLVLWMLDFHLESHWGMSDEESEAEKRLMNPPEFPDSWRNDGDGPESISCSDG